MELPANLIQVEWSFFQRSLFRFAALVVPKFCHNFFQFEVSGLENTSDLPEGKPVIFCGNHRSHLDGLLLGSAIIKPYGNRTRLGFMASGKAMDGNVFFGLLRVLGAFPVYRENPNLALDYAVRLLKKGLGVLIAPQGKRIFSHPLHDYFNLLKEGRTGVGRVILKLNGKVPIVPFYCHGAAEALGIGRIVPKYKAFVSVSFGKPLYFDDYSQNGGWDDSKPEFYETSREIVNKVMISIRNLLVLQEQHYFNIIKKKFRVKELEDIIIPTGSRKTSLNKFLYNLLHYHPRDLQRLAERSK
ncbi:MAG: lysophospholipid acyltransferase family protein [Candidatus Heimdallarchaeota archaeon]